MSVPPPGLSDNPITATISGCPVTQRWLPQMGSSCMDRAVYQVPLKPDDGLVDQVTNIGTASRDGATHDILGWLMPGRVGAEYLLDEDDFKRPESGE